LTIRRVAGEEGSLAAPAFRGEGRGPLRDRMQTGIRARSRAPAAPRAERWVEVVREGRSRARKRRGVAAESPVAPRTQRSHVGPSSPVRPNLAARFFCARASLPLGRARIPDARCIRRARGRRVGSSPSYSQPTRSAGIDIGQPAGGKKKKKSIIVGDDVVLLDDAPETLTRPIRDHQAGELA